MLDFWHLFENIFQYQPIFFLTNSFVRLRMEASQARQKLLSSCRTDKSEEWEKRQKITCEAAK
jgi:hypothetical protein